MQCEICGESIRGTPKLIRVEGVELHVCPKCEKYGPEVQKPKRAEGKITLIDQSERSRIHSAATRPSDVIRRKRDLFDYIEGEIIDDYGERIRKAREEKGLSTKELALQMMERELLIKKIEKGELIPEDTIRKKLEKILEIRLVDTEEECGEHRLNQTRGNLSNVKKSKS